ncbi:MAG TPA: hypothetical protein VHV10_14875 [Ktedonobacteraceae bacterium]|jgi:HAMP domain-containing protein|nr:hypothetical protein [Ktedonobacteraceae bacterium]
MNQPTREEFDELKQEQERLRQEQEVLKKRLEQATEPMKAINVNVASADVITKLNELEQKLDERSNTWLNTLQQNYQEHQNAMAMMKQEILEAVRKISQPGGNGH